MTQKNETPAAGTTGAPDGVAAGRVDTSENKQATRPPQARSWRDVLPIHPAADLLPVMSASELSMLADDIAEHRDPPWS